MYTVDFNFNKPFATKDLDLNALKIGFSFEDGNAQQTKEVPLISSKQGGFGDVIHFGGGGNSTLKIIL